MSEAKCKGGDCGEATYSTSKVEGAHYKADADTWRTDTPLFCSLECPRREALERALKGKPAASTAAPVERALVTGWSWSLPTDYNRCLGCSGCLSVGRTLSSPDCKFHCLPCAEKAGAFATPAPTVARHCNGHCGDLGNCTRACFEDTAPVVEPPAPKPAPRCEYRTAAHEGTPVERVMFHGGEPKRMFACDECYLFSEAHFPPQWRDGTPADNRPRATVGVVPQVFGLSVGILSRGML